MGSFVEFRCGYCNYEATDIGVGRGQSESLRLSLFVCDNCKSVGSTWTGDGRGPMCSLCYDEHPRMLSDDITRLNCPKCGKPAHFIAKEGSWE